MAYSLEFNVQPAKTEFIRVSFGMGSSCCLNTFSWLTEVNVDSTIPASSSEYLTGSHSWLNKLFNVPIAKVADELLLFLGAMVVN